MKTIEEYQEEINNLESKIEDMEEKIQSLESDNGDLSDEIDTVRTDLNNAEIYNENREEFAECSFNAGYKAKENNDTLIRGWLNYKVEARI